MGKVTAAFALWALAACPSSEDSHVEPAAVVAPARNPEAARTPPTAPEIESPAVAEAPTPSEALGEAPPSETPTDVAERGPEAMAPDLGPWVSARIREAHLGVRQYVRLPLVYRGPFGCDCPDNYVGVDPFMMDGGEFLTVENESAQPLPDYDPMEGMVVLVDGYFAPGRTRYDGGDPADPYFMHPFHITRIVQDQPRGRALERTRLSLLGEATECQVQVNDPESPLNVRARPSSRAETVGTLDHGTTLTAEGHRASWTRIAEPVEGWVWTAGTRVACPPLRR